MKMFIGLYCRYDPDNYMGHRIRRFESESIDTARIEFTEWLRKQLFMTSGDIEVQIYEYSNWNGPFMVSLK